MTKKCISKAAPKSSGGCDTDQPPDTIRKLISCWITEKEASDVLSQFHKACVPNNQLLWSGMLRQTAQEWADAHGFQTLTTSLGPLLRTDDPACCYCQKSPQQRNNYMHGSSIIFAWFISHGDLVTVLSRPPPQRFHPSGRTFYQLYEEPIVKGEFGNTSVKRIVVAHPMIGLAVDFTYELWPRDQPSLWTKMFGKQDIVIPWRKVKTSEKAIKVLKLLLSLKSKITPNLPICEQLSASDPISMPSASTVKTDVMKTSESSRALKKQGEEEEEEEG